MGIESSFPEHLIFGKPKKFKRHSIPVEGGCVWCMGYNTSPQAVEETSVFLLAVPQRLLGLFTIRDVPADRACERCSAILQVDHGYGVFVGDLLSLFGEERQVHSNVTCVGKFTKGTMGDLEILRFVEVVGSLHPCYLNVAVATYFPELAIPSHRLAAGDVKNEESVRRCIESCLDEHSFGLEFFLCVPVGGDVAGKNS